MLPDEPLGWMNWLARRHDAELPELRELDALYEGTAPLVYMHPEIVKELGDRLPPVSLGWPQLAIEPLEERLDFLGFRDRTGSLDDNLRKVYQYNDLDEESQLGHLDALAMRRSYLAVGANDDDRDIPLVTVESPLELFTYIDPRGRKPRAALRRWSEDQDSLVRLPEQFATLYLPDETIWYDQGPNGWRETGRDRHKLGEVPIAPLVNRSRTANRYGRSELTVPMLTLSHAANKLATDMMIGAEFHAIPLRALLGVDSADFVDEQGNRKSALQVIMGKLLAIPVEDANSVKPFEFTASALTNFHDSMTQLAKHATALAGLPPTAFGVVTDTPASAEAWRAAEARLVKRAERRQQAFSGGHERAARLVHRIQEGDWDPRARELESQWRDPATPTRAQAADAAVKLYSEGITTRRQTRIDLGYTPGQIAQMEIDDEDEDELRAATKQVAQPVVDPAGGEDDDLDEVD
ncbi:phage portal protein [Actinoplanes sp. NPDC051851]|uniref:phage portal protein n=1 Tax=Actinoplanes sp. NPDC051851 TaxID=3154753 RepID=UPI00341AC351